MLDESNVLLQPLQRISGRRSPKSKGDIATRCIQRGRTDPVDHFPEQGTFPFIVSYAGCSCIHIQIAFFYQKLAFVVKAVEIANEIAIKITFVKGAKHGGRYLSVNQLIDTEFKRFHFLQ